VTIDITKSFEVSKHGFLISGPSGDIIWIGGGADAPTHDAPIGSRYFRTNKTEYKQEGPGLSDWILVEEGGSEFGILTNYIAFSPSRILREYGKSENGFNPNFDIRLLELHLQFVAEHTSQTKIRARLYKYNGSTQTDHLILSVTQDGVETSGEYYSLSDITPDTDHYDLDSSEDDTFWIEIDDGSGGKAYKIRELTVNIKYQKL
jgi:hypothetical protein